MVRVGLGFVVACLSLFAAQTALAGARGTNILPIATFEPIGSETLTPYGWVEFCSRNPDECQDDRRAPRDVVMTPTTWNIIRRVNSAVNHAIKPLSDMDHWGVIDRWDIPTDGYGDCEDYVLLKRKVLIGEGFPQQALLVTVVKDEQGDGHALLTVRTDRGEFVLDNMSDVVRPWNESSYRFREAPVAERSERVAPDRTLDRRAAGGLRRPALSPS